MATKQEARYEDKPEGLALKRCAFCSMYRMPDSCTLVKGKINPFGICRFWASALFGSPA